MAEATLEAQHKAVASRIRASRVSLALGAWLFYMGGKQKHHLSGTHLEAQHKAVSTQIKAGDAAAEAEWVQCSERGC